MQKPPSKTKPTLPAANLPTPDKNTVLRDSSLTQTDGAHQLDQAAMARYVSDALKPPADLNATQRICIKIPLADYKILTDTTERFEISQRRVLSAMLKHFDSLSHQERIYLLMNFR